LLVGHAFDGDVFDRPHPVIGNQNVEAAEVAHGLQHQAASCRGSAQIAGYGVTTDSPHSFTSTSAWVRAER
jgi:hypothetical protein